MRRYLVVSLCGALLLVGCSGSNSFSKVAGVVIDARTGRPLANAKVVVQGEPAITSTTNSAGSFTLTKVPKKSAIVVGVPHYSPAKAVAARDVGTIRVAPSPVTGRLLSNLDLAGVGGTVRTPAGTFASKPNGTFVIYGVGIGDTFTASAPGYAPQRAKVARNTTVVLSAMPATALAHDLPAIKQVWRDESDSWSNGGPDGALSYLSFADAHNYPGVAPQGVAAYSEEYVLDAASVDHDDHWIMDFGSLKGQTPSGRTYIMKLTTSYTNGSPEQLDEVHVTILNGKPYMFQGC
jgi:hypothetical protein